jgi:hypothetical protein
MRIARNVLPDPDEDSMSALPTPAGQLDLFIDSRATQLANTVLEALLERSANEAIARLMALRGEAPDHPLINTLQSLYEALHTDVNAAQDDSTAERLVDWLDTQITPAAGLAFGPAASHFMEPLWHALADARQEHPYRSISPSSFSAALYLRAGNPSAAQRAVARMPSHDVNGDALHWLAVAAFRADGLRAARPPLFRLAWLFPPRLPVALEAIADPKLLADWSEFGTDSDEFEFENTPAADGAWFPAWYLLQHPATQLSAAELGELQDVPPTRAFFALQRVLSVEPHGHSTALIDARLALREHAPALFTLYMRQRDFISG